MQIIDFRDEFAEKSAELAAEAINDSFSRVYPPEVCDFYKSINTAEQLKRQSRKFLIRVLLREQNIDGMVGLKGNSLAKLYVRPQYQNLGLGKLLISNIEDFAASKGINELILEDVVPNVEGFYRKLGYYGYPGYKDVRGLKVPIIRMSKRLSGFYVFPNGSSI